MDKLIAFFVRQKIFADLITVFVIVVGISCIFLMRREAFPNIKFDLITVNTVFPGASPDEVERLISSPLEVELKEVSGIKKIYSVSRESSSLILLQLDPDETTEFEAKSDIQDVIDRFKDLPEAAERPVVTAIEGGIYPVIQVSLTSSLNPLELRALARQIERELESLPNIAKVTPTGMQDLEIHVEVDLKKMNAYRISFEEVISSIKNQNVSVPGGGLTDQGSQKILVRTIGDYSDIESIEKTVIRANDLAKPIRVKDIAQIGFKLKDDSTAFRTNGKHAINLTILRKTNADSITLVESVKEKVKELEKKYSDKLSFRLLDDESVWIKMRLNTLSSNFIIGLILVLLVLSLLLPPTIALLVAAGIPFAFFGTMIIFYNIDYSLNLLTMLGLIIVVGMLVDDAVVTTENSMRLLDEGHTPEQAAIKGTRQVVASVFGSVMTTVLAFAPLMFMTGIFGKFVQFIPMGVILALLISLLQAYFILPCHFARWAYRPQDKINKNRLDKIYEAANIFWSTKVVPPYSRAVAKILRLKYRYLSGLAALFFVSLFVSTKLGFVLFPSDGIEIFFVTAEAPLGSSLEKTSNLLKPVEEKILALPKNELQDFTTQIGQQMKDPGDPNTRYGEHVAMLVVYLTPANERKRTVEEIINFLRNETKDIPDLKIGFEKVSGGPPVGKPISIAVQGDNYDEILKLAQLIKEELKNFNGTSDLELNYQVGNKEVLVHVDQEEAAAAGLTVASVGASVRAAIEGIVPTSIKKLDEEIEIRVSLPDQENKTNLLTLPKLLIPNQMGGLVPLARVAHFEESQGVAAYIHENNRREVRVLGQLDEKVTNAGQVVSHIRYKFADYKKDFPNLNLAFGGENEDTEESMQSLFRTFLLAFIGIFIVLILTFHNLIQPFLVAMTIPIGAMSVIYAFFIHGKPLSFMGILGIIALAGVIVNNAIVLVDFVNQLRQEGLDYTKSIVRAAELRLRPIFLTTVTTVAGILPTAYGIGGNDDFVKPIALALGWGLLLGSVIVVFFFPAMIAVLDDIIRKSSHTWKRVTKRQRA